MKYIKTFCSTVLVSSFLWNTSAVQACGPDSYVGTICVTAANYCPQGTLEANGQVLNISQNQALYSLLGQTYPGGNGSSTFALPNLQGRTPVGVGTGANLAPVTLGQVRGSEKVTLTVSNLPPHSHPLNVSNTQGTAQASSDTYLANIKADQGKTPVTATHFQPSASVGTLGAINGNSIGTIGGGSPIATLPPQLGLRYCVVNEGTYPAHP